MNLKVEHRARRILDRHKDMKTEKSLWNNLYQLMGEYIMTRKQHFTNEGVQGEIQTDHLFDDTAPNANHLMASSLIGALWPNAGKSFQIGMPFGMEEEIGDETEEVKQFYQRVTKRMAAILDNPKCGFLTALEEYMLDQGAFGISGILAEEQDDSEVPIVFRALDAKSTCIDEGANGFVNTIYIEKAYTVRQLVEKYGFENISRKWQVLYEKGDCKTKVRVLQAIEPRMERDPYGFGVENMPYASIHIDCQTEKIMKESGFSEMPAAVTRFWKAMGEKYGRSPGMNALPSILEANALGEAYIMAVEKNLDPPLQVEDDSIVGNGVVDSSPGAITIVSRSGRIGSSNQKAIEPLFLVGELQSTLQRRAELGEIIKNHFFQDRLMDLNNEQRMTLGEANIRNNLRGMTLNTVYSRQMAELLVPLLERVFNALLRLGQLGVLTGSLEEARLLAQGIEPLYIPDPVKERIMADKEVYRINFISPATRIMQAEELQGLEQTVTFAANTAGVKPEIMDNLDTDWIIRRVQELTGAPRETVISMETVRKIRDARNKAQAAMQQQEAQRQQSETTRNMAQAASQINGQGQGAA